MPTLRRIKDGAGDSGSLSQAIQLNNEEKRVTVLGSRPLVGCIMKVGSLTARSFSNKDFWMTTPITEILEEIKTKNTDYVRFKTGNSEYEWWSGNYPK